MKHVQQHQSRAVYCIQFVFLLMILGAGAFEKAFAADATIRLQSETKSIFLGDLVVLDIESTGLHDELDVSHLKESSDFVRETVGTRIAVINGSVVDINIRRMEFIPSTAGTIYYGPLRGVGVQGTVVSNSIVVEVKPPINNQWKPDEQHAVSSIELSNQEPVIGEQITMNITLRHRHPVANETVRLPDLENFDVVPLFEQRRTIVETDESWRQTSWRYLLFPKKSGTLPIANAHWSGTMIKSRTQRGEYAIDIAGPTLKVKPSINNEDDWWLPSSNVLLSDSWSKDVRTLSAGDEIFRTITLTAYDVLGNQLPNVEPLPSRALTSTLINTTRGHDIVNERSIAKAVFEFRMIAQSPIPVFLDTVRVPWWNVQTDEAEEAIIPARRINIGLPDRADLLADLAMSNSLSQRITGQLRSYARWQPLLISLIFLALLVAAIPLVKTILGSVRKTERQVQMREKLSMLQREQRWAELYREMKNLQKDYAHAFEKHRTAKGKKQQRAGVIFDVKHADFTQMLESLQLVLFSENDSAEKELARQNIRLFVLDYPGAASEDIVKPL